PVQSGDRIITEDEWALIRKRQDELSEKPRHRNESPLLAGIVYCTCGHRMYGFVQRTRNKTGKLYEYQLYKCNNRNGCGKQIHRKILDQWAEEIFLAEVGDLEQTVEKILPGNDITNRLEEAQNAFESLVIQAGKAKSKTAKQRLQQQLDALDTLIAELEEQEDTPDRAVRVGTGTTFREAWESDDTLESRRKMLQDAGVRITVESHNPFSANFHVDIDKLRDFIGQEQFDTLTTQTRKAPSLRA